MGWKYGVYGKACGNTEDAPAFNAVVFATQDEANRAGKELLWRWMAPDGFVTVQVDEEPNYTFPTEASRPQPIAKEV